jgi:GT2 family glycosyltransferase
MVVFVDDDIRCGPELISEHVAALSQPRVGVVAGGVNDPRCPDSSPAHSVGRFDRWRAEPVGGFDAAWEGDVDHARGCNFSTWKSLLTALGGIDETLQVGAALYEETDFCLRAREAGYRVYFNGRARLTHLNASDGGCRVTDVSAYIYGLSHNRAILIQRHLRWYQRPTALFALLRLGLAYSVRYRRPAALRSCFRGWRDGSRNDRGVTK